MAEVTINKANGHSVRDVHSPLASEAIRMPPNQQSLEFRIAASFRELEECFRLRLQAYTDAGYIKQPSVYQDGKEVDEFDAASTHFYARNLETGKLVGYARLIRDSPLGFPMEKQVSLEDFRSPDKTLMEFSRWISYPRGQPDVNWGLYRATVRYGLIQNVTHFVGLAFVRMKHFYESRGFAEIEPYQEVVYKGGGGHDPSALFFATVFDFHKIFVERGANLTFRTENVPDREVFRGLDPDPRIKIAASLLAEPQLTMQIGLR